MAQPAAFLGDKPQSSFPPLANRPRPGMFLTVAVIEASPFVREGLRELVDRTSGLRCAGVHETSEEALCLLRRSKPDVVLVDLDLLNAAGLDCLARFKACSPHSRVLVLVWQEDGDVMLDCMNAGADGCLLKTMLPSDLVNAIRQAGAGAAAVREQSVNVSNVYSRRQAERSRGRRRLTRRQQDIFELMVRGYTCKEIGGRLRIHRSTVRSHLHSIFRKIGAKFGVGTVGKLLQQRGSRRLAGASSVRTLAAVAG